MTYLWTSEAVSNGHPDKVADQVADAILDSYLANDPDSKVACEVVLTKNLAVISGEVSSSAKLDIELIVRKTICDIGYDGDWAGYNGNTIAVLNQMKKQSHQIQKAVFKEDGTIGAGDQGFMFGYACDETDRYMPLAHAVAFDAINLLKMAKDKHTSALLLPDAKSQATIGYRHEIGTGNLIPTHVDTILVSTQHNCTLDFLNKTLQEDVFEPLKSSYPGMFDERTKYLVNPAGEWTFGGPGADTGLSGRKIIVDNYGADCPHGGGSFSGKDPSKVDRSGAYAARHIAKNIVAAGLAKKCRVQISYAIGVVEPISFNINTFGTAVWGEDICGRSGMVPITNEYLEDMVRELVSLAPKSIIDRFQLKRPIYKETASGGHFGRDQFPWENLDLKEKFLHYIFK